MTTFHPWRTAVAVAAAWLMGLGAVTTHASEIRDDAKFFSPEVVTKVTEDLNRLEKRSRVQTIVETHETLPASKLDQFNGLRSKEEKDKFFHSWMAERAKADSAKGLFVLITRKPGHLDVGISDSLKARGLTVSQRNQIRDSLVKNFKVEEYDAGLKSVVTNLETISLRLGDARHATQVAHQQPHRPAAAPAAGGGEGMGIWGWVLLAVVVWVVFAIISAVIRGMSGGYRGGYQGQPGYGYGGAPGYGGGGFFSNMLGGLAGAMAGNWLYDSMSGSGQAHAGDNYGGTSNDSYDNSGGDFGGSDFGGSDFGSGDFGGGDYGGGGDF